MCITVCFLVAIRDIRRCSVSNPVPLHIHISAVSNQKFCAFREFINFNFIWCFGDTPTFSTCLFAKEKPTNLMVELATVAIAIRITIGFNVFVFYMKLRRIPDAMNLVEKNVAQSINHFV